MLLGRSDCAISADNFAHEPEETVTFAVCFAHPSSSQPSLPAYLLGKGTQPAPRLSSDLLSTYCLSLTSSLGISEQEVTVRTSLQSLSLPSGLSCSLCLLAAP
ncbi:hypothetical protein WJX77_008655 [Trebouxia sp. C0004]